jgi:hypothetical protein
MEADIRTIVDALYAEMIPENTLGGAVISSTIASVDSPIPYEANDPYLPFVQVPFNITIDETIERC